MNEPPNPITAENTSSAFKSRPLPLSSRIRSTPSRRSTILSTKTIARLVSRKSAIRFIQQFPRLTAEELSITSGLRRGTSACQLLTYYSGVRTAVLQEYATTDLILVNSLGP